MLDANRSRRWIWLLLIPAACLSCSSGSGRAARDLSGEDQANGGDLATDDDPTTAEDSASEPTDLALDPDGPQEEPDQLADGDLPINLCVDPSQLPSVVRGDQGTVKICQLTGEYDRERDQETVNLTYTRADIYGTDLGASFEHEGALWFLFGDTVGARMLDEDAIAYSQDTDPSNCLDLTFLVGDGGAWHPLVVPGISLGAFEVPMEGVSVGGTMYVYFTTDHSSQHVMGRSILARSVDDGRTFEYVADISDLSSEGHFINLSAVVIDNEQHPGLPAASGQSLLIWGSGEYRQSTVALAWQPLEEIENPSSIRYFVGTSQDRCIPQWSENESEASLLFDDEPCVGELSVEWNPHLAKWLMTYNCINPRGIRFRTADYPWGPWSDSQNLFHPWDDGGYCHFIHTSHLVQQCDEVHDPGRENEWGGEYGPYQIAPLAESIDGGSAVYFVMSTWNPYNVVLMRSDLLLE
ncbi:MAG: DUF4185 domain-containing protein [Bradymonadales bacterium]|nr:DUF4185 domain-containing protein [Bradymonadales bacterium]